jgi:hypothetical protein
VRSIKRTLAAATLTLEAFVVFFAALVAKDLSSLSTAAAVGGGSAIAVVCLLTAGLLRLRVGYLIGSALQVVLIGTGAWVPMMFFVGALFAGLWAVSLYWGARIERERAIVAAGLAE